jgi:hypothetical protein
MLSAGVAGMRYIKPDVAPGQRFYDGRICKTCGGTRRYVRGGTCVTCAKTHYRAQAKTSGIIPRSERPPPEIITERDRTFSVTETFATRYLGDPLPGRSALDKRAGAS